MIREIRAAAAASIRWLGQAGFLIEWSGRHRDSEQSAAPKKNRLVIDPYLSDFLAKKYKGKKFDHSRMMPPPIQPGELLGLDFYLCTHRHSDHMDPETLPLAAENNPEALFVVPASQENRALELGVSADRIIGVDGGEIVDLGAAVHGGTRSGLVRPGGGTGNMCGQITVKAVPAAHEKLELDDRGRHLFLGYIIRFPGFTVYHSGDCVPYPGLPEKLGRGKRGAGMPASLQSRDGASIVDERPAAGRSPASAGRGAADRAGTVDLALLPVNGRDRYRRENGIPGNFTVREALELCSRAGIPYLIPHHFGMFGFNTLPAEEIRSQAELFQEAAEQKGGTAPEIIIPETGCRYDIFTA